MRRHPSGGPEIGAPWAAYEPDASAPWDLRRVVHLHRRAGFAANWAELQRDLKDGPEASIDRILQGRSRIGGVADDFESTSELIAGAAVDSRDPARLKAWWVFRMLGSPDPLGERLTLLWHDHFATALSKVADLGLLLRQNATHRRLARAPFGDLLEAEAREPALLLYLDAPSNRKGHPNENLARELMELFTLGIGRYTEADVKEAARALTGWTVEEGEFREVPASHDDGEKTIFGQTGPFDGSKLLKILAGQSATARRLASRLCGLLLGEGAADSRAIDALAEILRANRLDVGLGVETILRSRAFFAAADLGRRVVEPAEYVVGACRALLPAESRPSTLILADWIARLGQDLFDPPNVGGWPGGRAWLSGRSMIARSNFASALVAGRPIGLPGPVEPPPCVASPAADPIEAASLLLLGSSAPPEIRRALSDASSIDPGRALALVLGSPEAQLC